MISSISKRTNTPGKYERTNVRVSANSIHNKHTAAAVAIHLFTTKCQAPNLYCISGVIMAVATAVIQYGNALKILLLLLTVTVDTIAHLYNVYISNTLWKSPTPNHLHNGHLFTSSYRLRCYFTVFEPWSNISNKSTQSILCARDTIFVPYLKH